MSAINGLDCANVLLEKLCKSRGINNPKIELKQATVKGDGYMSIIYSAKITSDKKTLSVIVKTAPQGEKFREVVRIPQVYFQEIYFYDTIFPAFYKFQIEKGVEDPFSSVPRCLATSLSENFEGLVLENLKDEGYQLWDRKEPMDGEHISFVLREYGRFHALSFSLREQNEELYNEFASNITDFYEIFSQNEAQGDMMVEQMNKMLQLFDQEDEKEVYQRFKSYIEACILNGEKFLSKNMDKYTVIAHGDCWCNNMMFKYEDAQDPLKPTKMRLLDFQILRLVSPVIDVVHYFYTASPKDVLDNYKHYIDIYYNSLSTHLKKLGSDPENVYPRSKFDEHWKKYCTHGLSLAIFMVKIMLSEREEVPDFAKTAEEGGCMMDAVNYEPRNLNYKQRVRDAVIHFVENGFI